MIKTCGTSSCGVGFVCDINGKESHDIVTMGVEAVKNLTHRGAVGADGKTGDGAGVLMQLPKSFFLREVEKTGHELSDINALAVGFFFLYGQVESTVQDIIERYGLKALGWRDVPTNDDALGQAAFSTKPRIRQLLIDTKSLHQEKIETRLFLARKAIEKICGKEAYIPSLSAKTIVYKGMLVATQLDTFYPDLKNQEFESAFCIFHQRFSTNTSPDWTMSQPLRVIAHNGEINTIQGNRNWIASIEHDICSDVFGDDGGLLRPLVSIEESDSASLDRVLELLMLAGFSPEEAINTCIPPAWECCDYSYEGVHDELKSLFEYLSFLMAPWDGPAAVTFTDGTTIGAHLDRNGLRPLRYTVTEEGTMLLGSETGMLSFEGRTIKEQGRLGPGDTIAVNLATGKVRTSHQIIAEFAGQKPYGDWIDKFLRKCKSSDATDDPPDREITRKQIAFGYTLEEMQTSIREMAETAREMTYSMGDDTPLPSLSIKPQLLFRYFKQRFAQVTNPSIDPIREKMVMSLKMNLGWRRNFLHQTPEHARKLQLDSPILSGQQMQAIVKQDIFRVERIYITYSTVYLGLSTAITNLQEKVVEAVKGGNEIIVLSDRDISKERVAIPSLLAVSASFKSLQSKGLANRVSLTIETGEARDVHHMACLIGYGASAIYPYLAFQTVKEMHSRDQITLSCEKASINYKSALDDGLFKVIARMGISALDSYHGAQLFDTVCLNKNLVDEYFGGTPVGIESDGIAEIEESLMRRHDLAYRHLEPTLDYGGALKYRKDGERHAWSPPSVIALNKFVRSSAYADYAAFSMIANEHFVYMRHLLDYKRGKPISIEKVETEDRILKRFVSGAMSVGALSPEAHEAIAEACNRLGMRSNSGEGGEDPSRYWSIKNSAIKQVASGRFGVTPTYLASAAEIEIKVAQGAKPGEGGHLPSAKVTEYIAKLRHCNPNTLLISPPPHHDIYSIEDLAQLINDLKQANPEARICVKLVSELGVGTVAAGVAKAYADIVQISGYEGGTGAAPITSIKNVGNYWEVGLAETQRVLMENGLRDRIRIRVDGGLRTGRDVVIAALLGAEEFGFGTATMIAAGCVMARQCHLNTCPTGIATQDERLRARFRGEAEGIMAYFRALAHEVRVILAEMGVSSLDEITGMVDLLTMRTSLIGDRVRRIQFSELLKDYPEGSRRCLREANNSPALSMNDKLVADLMPFIERGEPIKKEYEIRNLDRSIPVKLNYYISLKYRDAGLPPDTLTLTFRGTAGQSFGAFNHKGISLTLVGDANDYVGKGMFGGRVVIKPVNFKEPHKHVILGNTVLYGATGGELYASGRAGERFAVRNSGAIAVVEGASQHLCEYMTKGVVVVIGAVGYNVGAGMTGGVIYLFDEFDVLKHRLNTSYVKALDLEDDQDIATLKSLIEEHHRCTESPRAGEILGSSDGLKRHFKKIVPI